MSKRKNSQQKKSRGKLRMLTLPHDLDAWLVENTRKRGASTVQETIRQMLTAVKSQDQQAA